MTYHHIPYKGIISNRNYNIHERQLVIWSSDSSCRSKLHPDPQKHLLGMLLFSNLLITFIDSFV